MASYRIKECDRCNSQTLTEEGRAKYSRLELSGDKHETVGVDLCAVCYRDFWEFMRELKKEIPLQVNLPVTRNPAEPVSVRSKRLSKKV